MRTRDLPSGRDPHDARTIDLEAWLVEDRIRRAARLRAAHPEMPMVQLPLMLHERTRREVGAGGCC